MISSGKVDSFKNGTWAHGERNKESRSSATRQLSERHPSKNMPAQSLNWHGVSKADLLQGADFMRALIL